MLLRGILRMPAEDALQMFGRCLEYASVKPCSHFAQNVEEFERHKPVAFGRHVRERIVQALVL